MARIRTIKPEFPQSESIGRLSREARLFFIQLWTIADDAGIARASSRMLASLLYPYDEDAAGCIPSWLAELEAEGHVRLYEVNGSHYLDIPNWLKHQKIDHPTPSKLPIFSRNPREDQRELRPGPGKEGNGREGTGTGRDRDRDPTGKDTVSVALAQPPPPSQAAPRSAAAPPQTPPRPLRAGMSPDMGEDYRSPPPPDRIDAPPMSDANREALARLTGAWIPAGTRKPHP